MKGVVQLCIGGLLGFNVVLEFNHAMEKDPTFFKQPRKVQLFGYRVDGFRQYNFLIDDDQTIGIYYL